MISYDDECKNFEELIEEFVINNREVPQKEDALMTVEDAGQCDEPIAAIMTVEEPMMTVEEPYMYDLEEEPYINNLAHLLADEKEATPKQSFVNVETFDYCIAPLFASLVENEANQEP